MKKFLLFLILLVFSGNLFAFDSDMDGVSDAKDKCPNTPFTDLVDIDGCTKKSLTQNYHYDIIVGLSSTSSDYTTLNKTDTLATTIQADYYYKNFSFQAATSIYTERGNGYNESGLQDSFLGAAYQVFPTTNFAVRFSIGAILPTYDSSLNNNKTDYTAGVNVSYNIDKLNLFGGYGYTLINDTDYSNSIISVYYQNTHSYSGGVGYNITDKLYMSGTYTNSDSIYVGVEKVETASLYAYYSIDKNWFSTFSYAYGISDSASQTYIAVKLGYFF
ncbi:DUF3187 domain-containing protein [Sulfurimonas sp. C5]|uniref:DUF3187 domain-containing protein n=1 Tax=Sulfurimonas sp. C5 TaxID=3036947 RepID=UPI002458F7BF|nr:DUF3187 domain-containing protein [Sulfurimonas sp. C5]MDH4944438.1 DUF3187 domain-containing protein [Sulfurimonas sp. C5]